FKYKFLSFVSCLPLNSPTKRLLHRKSEAIVLASAVRTPWAKFRGQLATVSAWQLGRLAADTAVKQSAVPLEDIKHIIMAENPLIQKDPGFIFSDFLKKNKYCGIEAGKETNLLPFKKALDILKSQPEAAVVVGGLESATQNQQKREVLATNLDLLADVSPCLVENYIKESKLRFLQAQKENKFEPDIVALTVKQRVDQRNVIKEVKQDEVCAQTTEKPCNLLPYSDGASAFVLCTRSKAHELNLSPLAEIVAYESVTSTQSIIKNSVACIEKLFAKGTIDLNSIQHWEIDDYIPQLVVYLKHHFKLDMELINPQGGSLIMGHSPAASFLRLVTHLTHALKPQQTGCVISFNSKETLALIIKKLPSVSCDESLPLITLYTKDPCPLCDVLVEELESNFAGEYKLEKVYIDTKENVRFLRLYRFDIPVAFLNQQFLCMHRLNHRLLRQKLDLLKQQ
ncbi:hypothetical protein DOY81_005225, partial [Sarcophaga bullata]